MVCLIYAPGISGPFLFDDKSNITANSYIQVDELSYLNLYSAATSGNAGPLKRPIPTLSFALNYYFSGGYNIAAYKITNIIIHCVNTALLLFLIKQLLVTSDIQNKHSVRNKNFFYLAIIISTIWAIHPINLTSILYIVQRMTSLSTLFSLCCLIFYTAGRNRHITTTHPVAKTSIILFSLSIICFILALYSKENALILPLIVLWIECTLYPHKWLQNHYSLLSRTHRRLLFISIATLAISILLISINYTVSGYQTRPFTIIERSLTETRVLCFYISLILLPRINAFGLFHDDITLSTSLLSPWTTVTSIIFIGALVVSVFYYRREKPLYSLGIGWFLIGHLLESTFFPLEIAHEHRNYFPSIGLILAVTSIISTSNFTKKQFIAAFFITASLLGSTTWLRASQWSGYSSLAHYETLHHPMSTAAQALLSNAAYQAGDVPTAIEAIKSAINLNPNDPTYLIHYQNLLSISNQEIPLDLQAKTIKKINQNLVTPSLKLALEHVASCLNKTPCEALKKNYIPWLDAIIKKAPNDPFYYYLKGKAYRALNDNMSALNAFQQSHSLREEYMHPLFEMADILIQANQLSHVTLVLKWIKLANIKTTFKRDKEIQKLESIIATMSGSANN